MFEKPEIFDINSSGTKHLRAPIILCCEWPDGAVSYTVVVFGDDLPMICHLLIQKFLIFKGSTGWVYVEEYQGILRGS